MRGIDGARGDGDAGEEGEGYFFCFGALKGREKEIERGYHQKRKPHYRPQASEAQKRIAQNRNPKV